MGLLSYVPIIGDLLDKTHDIVDQVVEDKDKKNEIFQALTTIGQQVYVKELETKTIPWIDGLHKLGRQILNYLTLVIVGLLIWQGHVFTQWDVLLLTGGNVAYQVIKGVGQK